MSCGKPVRPQVRPHTAPDLRISLHTGGSHFAIPGVLAASPPIAPVRRSTGRGAALGQTPSVSTAQRCSPPSRAPADPSSRHFSTNRSSPALATSTPTKASMRPGFTPSPSRTPFPSPVSSRLRPRFVASLAEQPKQGAPPSVTTGMPSDSLEARSRRTPRTAGTGSRAFDAAQPCLGCACKDERRSTAHAAKTYPHDDPHRAGAMLGAHSGTRAVVFGPDAKTEKRVRTTEISSAFDRVSLSVRSGAVKGRRRKEVSLPRK